MRHPHFLREIAGVRLSLPHHQPGVCGVLLDHARYALHVHSQFMERSRSEEHRVPPLGQLVLQFHQAAHRAGGPGHPP